MASKTPQYTSATPIRVWHIGDATPPGEKTRGRGSNHTGPARYSETSASFDLTDDELALPDNVHVRRLIARGAIKAKRGKR